MDTSVIGKKGENLAQEYFWCFWRWQNYIATNFRYKRFGEIDLVTKKASTIHFVEVKTRKNNLHGYPYESVGYKKLNKIVKTAEVYREHNNMQELDYQFDIISITLSDKSIIYYENVTL